MRTWQQWRACSSSQSSSDESPTSKMCSIKEDVLLMETRGLNQERLVPAEEPVTRGKKLLVQTPSTVPLCIFSNTENATILQIPVQFLNPPAILFQTRGQFKTPRRQ